MVFVIGKSIMRINRMVRTGMFAVACTIGGMTYNSQAILTEFMMMTLGDLCVIAGSFALWTNNIPNENKSEFLKHASPDFPLAARQKVLHDASAIAPYMPYLIAGGLLFTVGGHLAMIVGSKGIAGKMGALGISMLSVSFSIGLAGIFYTLQLKQAVDDANNAK
jgi:hypothetical protein